MEELNEFQKWCKEILPVVQAAANGISIQARNAKIDDAEWFLADECEIDDPAFHMDLDEYEYRIKPRTITVNCFEVPEPMRDAPEAGDVYYAAELGCAEFYSRERWDGHAADSLWLSRGICHSTKESAIAHAKAMLGIDPNGDSK